jgi:hypothetical protein
MKKQTLINLATIGILLIGVFYFLDANRKQKNELVKKEKEILELWDSKIAEYQFLVNVTFRDSEVRKYFFDRLDNCYKKMRLLLNKKELSEIDKKEFTDFIMGEFPEIAGMKKEEILKRLNIENQNQIFNGSNLEIVKRLEKLFNPSFMTKCVSFKDFDIWEKQENWNLNPGDTTKLMIRLLKNYDLSTNQLEFFPSENLKIIEPYLGELKVIIPKDAKENQTREVSFILYDWIKKDTVIQKIYLHSN